MKDIPGYEGRYAVTKDGKIWSHSKSGGTKNGKWLKNSDHYKGYSIVTLADKNGKRKGVFVHRAVAITFIPNPCFLKEINHKNADKKDNRVSNLEWSSRLDNMRHAYKNNLVHILSGEKHGNAKLTWKKVREIRNIYIKGVTKQRDLAKKYSITQRVIWGIVNNVSWKES
jgi:hypothetical protein